MNSAEQVKILLVDDDEVKLMAVKSMLAHFDRNLVVVNSGKEALRALLSQDFALILMDVNMPVMDGFETAALIRQRDQSASVPIIFITAADKSDTHAARGYSLGAVDYIYTPIVPEILRAKVAVFVALKVQADSLRAAAAERAAMAETLSRSNSDLEEANQKLKETQVHLIQTEKMASLGQLVAGIAHEINNPLAFVLSHLFTVRKRLDLIAPEMEARLPEASAENLKKVCVRLREMGEGLDRVKELVLNLRTFSRMDQGEFKDIDVHESIDSVLLFLQHKMKGRIQVKKQYGLVGKIACSPGQLNQVVMNLVANAIDAIEGPGTIRIGTGRAEGFALICVRDSGKGIPESIRNRIFEPFFTTKPIGQGTGLGLAISYGIVKAHGGCIEVESELGSGTQFTVKIRLDLKSKTTS